MRILLVDDNEDFLDSTKDVLVDEGYEVVTATNGEDAVSLAESRDFNVVLMDIKMPGLNGVESFLKMKEHNPDVRVILFTAYSMESLIARAKEEGACSVLAKPLDMSRLLDAIASIRDEGKGGCILLADDDKAFCDNLSDSLQAEGYAVVAACNGCEAESEAKERSFDILLLDMKIPPKNGLEVYKHIKKTQPDIVTIILTGYSTEMSDLIDQTINENAYTFLTKPVRIPELLDLLKQAIGARKKGSLRKPGRGKLHLEKDSD
jgi:DNA-binding NtrC family response regulator